AVDAARGTDERFPSRLPDVGQVLAVDEQKDAADLPRHQNAEHAVRPALRAEWIGLQALRARVEPFDAEAPGAFPFPGCVETDAVTRRQGHVDAAFVGR